jgi:hypothetical protein
MKRRFLIGAAIAACCTQTSHTVEPREMQMCGASLSIGMPRAAALKAVERQCQADLIGADGFYSLFRKASIGTSKLTSQGTLKFAGDRLLTVTRDWANTAEIEMATGLFGIALAMEKEGHTKCALSTHVGSNPSLELRQVFLDCGAKTITLNLFGTGTVPPSAQLTESVR